MERSSSVSGLLSHTDFATVFLEKPDMASHGLDELCAKNVASRWVRRALSQRAAGLHTTLGDGTLVGARARELATARTRAV